MNVYGDPRATKVELFEQPRRPPALWHARSSPDRSLEDLVGLICRRALYALLFTVAMLCTGIVFA